MRKKTLLTLVSLFAMCFSQGLAQTTLPYSIDFTQGAEGWGQIDMSGNEHGVTWWYDVNGGYFYQEYKPCVSIRCDAEGVTNDYLVSPAFNLEAGKTYQVVTTTKKDANDAGELTLKLGTNSDDASSFSTDIATLYPSTAYVDYTEQPSEKNTFTVSKSGIYYIAYHLTADPYEFTLYSTINFTLKEYDPSEDIPDEPAKEAKQVPYSIGFDVENDEWTALDLSDIANNTWTYSTKAYNYVGTWYPAITTLLDESSNINDYYVSPAIALEAGKTYKVSTVSARMFASSSVLTVELGTSASDVSANTTLATLTPASSGYADNIPAETTTFSVEESGEYYLSLHNAGAKGDYGVQVFSFSIEETVDTPDVPAEPEELPYAIDFAYGCTGWTAIDASETPGAKWTYGNDAYFYYGNYYAGVSIKQELSDANDYFVSPAFNLEAGKAYKVTTLTTDNDGGYDGKAATLTLELGTSATDASSFATPIATLNPATDSAEPYGLPTESNTFIAPENGVYHIAFHDVAPVGDMGLQLFKFAIEETVISGIDSVVAVANAYDSATATLTLPEGFVADIYDMQGRHVLSSTETIVNLNGLSNGIYIIHITDAEGNTSSIKIAK